MVAGAERQRRLDLDGELVGGDVLAVMRAMDDEAAGRHRHEVFEARLDPVFGRDGVEGKRRGDLGARRIGHELAQQVLVRRVGKMHA